MIQQSTKNGGMNDETAMTARGDKKRGHDDNGLATTTM
jgi:hypothetical protein